MKKNLIIFLLKWHIKCIIDKIVLLFNYFKNKYSNFDAVYNNEKKNININISENSFFSKYINIFVHLEIYINKYE